MSQKVFLRWKDVLLKLQEAEEVIQKTQIQAEDKEMIVLLKELIKEQNANEDADIVARQIR